MEKQKGVHIFIETNKKKKIHNQTLRKRVLNIKLFL